MPGIIIFALVAAFLSLRLYAVLGKRTGHEQSFGKPDEKALQPVPAVRAVDETRERPQLVEAAAPVVEDSAAAGLHAIAAADRNFSADEFVLGARQAYRMILEAFWKGEIDSVSSFVAEDVRTAFGEAIAARAEAGEVLDNRLVAVTKAVVSDAEYHAGIARITIRFDADIAAVTRDTSGNVIAGSMVDAVPTHDAWTFTRDIRQADPNWILTDTDEAA